MTKKPNKT